MLTFHIDCNNHITVLNPTPQAQVNEEAGRSSSVKDVDRREALAGPTPAGI